MTEKFNPFTAIFSVLTSSPEACLSDVEEFRKETISSCDERPIVTISELNSVVESLKKIIQQVESGEIECTGIVVSGVCARPSDVKKSETFHGMVGCNHTIMTSLSTLMLAYGKTNVALNISENALNKAALTSRTLN